MHFPRPARGAISRKVVVSTENGKAYLHICGCRGSLPMSGPEYAEFGGATTCFVLKKDSYALVIDCGTGLFNAAGTLASCSRIDVLLTHMHYDHILGLLNWQSFPENAKLTFYSTFKNSMKRSVCSRYFSSPFWPVNPIRKCRLSITKPNQVYELQKGVSAEFVPAPHGDSTSALFIDFYGKKIRFLCDFEHIIPFPEKNMYDCDLLVYDGMFTRDEYREHVGWGHSTWEDGCELAKRVNAKKVIITHHEPHRTDEQLREMERHAKEEYSMTVFARDGMTITL